jgi:DeoR/GlpR family transcriptional regulator of sugar metabolism
MFPAERRHRILELVRQNGAVSLRQLAMTVGTSEVTIRRDVRALEADGLIDRRHGGAMLPGRLTREPTYSQKTLEAADEKRAIAAHAATLVDPGDPIVIGGGTTTEGLATFLVGKAGLTVVTNSLLVGRVLAQADQVEVVVTGGVLRGAIYALVGDAVATTMGSLRVRRAFLSGNGLTEERGLSTPNMLVASADRTMVASALEVVVLADYTKVGLETMFQTVSPAQMTHLVTDDQADPAVLAALAGQGVTVHVVSPGTGEVKLPYGAQS